MTGHQAFQMFQEQLEACSFQVIVCQRTVRTKLAGERGTDSCVVALSLQLCDLLLALQQLLPAEVQLFGQHRKLLQGRKRRRLLLCF